VKLMIGVDDSPHSLAAADYVRERTWPAGSEAIVVSVVRPAVAIYTEVYVPATHEFEGVMEDRLRHHEELVARTAKALRDSGLAATTRVVQGDPREVLVDLARQEGVQLLVVGSHGRTGLSKLLMGSVAAHVVGHAPCNVLVVRLRPATR
jgi:nucleotide-binding universal stress UspA family protein